MNDAEREIKTNYLQLEESEKQYRKLFEPSRDAIMILDKTGFIDGNQAVIRMFGCLALDDFKGRHPSKLSPPTQPCGTDSMILANRHIAMALKEGSARFEWMHKRVDGKVFPAEVLLSALELNGKKILQATVRDITRRKQAEDALKKSKRMYQIVVEQVSDGIAIVQEGMVVYVNPAIEKMWSKPTEGIIGRFFLDLIHPDEHERLAEIYKQRMAGGGSTAPYETRCLRADGETLWVEMMGKRIEYQDRPANLVSVRNITERIKAKLALEKANKATEASNRSLRSLIDIAQVGIVVHKNGKILLANAYMLKRMGVSSLDAVMGEDYAQFLHPDDRMNSLQRSKQVLEHGGDHKSMPVRAISASGACFDFEVSSTMIEYDGKEAVLTVSIDMTEKNRATESLLTLSSAVEQAGESILITDRGGIIEYVNPAFTRITGYSAEEAIGQTPRLLNSGNQDAAFYADMWETITDGEVWHGKVIDKRKDGSFYPAMLTISPISDNASDGITHFVGIQSDLSSLEDMENRFHQAQKMDAVGTMVGGIAHNFNNMLAGMTGNLYLAKQKVQGQPDVVQKLANIEELSDHAAEMIQQLLAFARKGMISIKDMPLASFISETLKLLRASVPENIAVHQDICADNLQIKGDATQLHQVLVNLVNNACDAIESVNEPCITIRLKSLRTDDAFIESHPYFKAGVYAHLSVADNGMGISGDHAERLFEPFFTTKEEGKGTGLGLAMVYGAIKTHHGFVEVDSSPGKGSTFHIYIPLLKPNEVAVDSVHALKAAEGKGELILLVDDEQVIREVMAEVLESLGYRIIMAEDGLEAFDIFKVHEQDISIALLDLIMPHMGGAQLAGQIRAMKPELPVIFMTGYDQGLTLAGEARIQNSKTFAKPVNFDDLSHNIRKMLD